MSRLDGAQRGVFFVGRADNDYQAAAFEGDLARWARGFGDKGHSTTLLYRDGRNIAGTPTQRATRDALLAAVAREASELDEDGTCWVVLGNHGDQEGDDQGKKRGVCTVESNVFVSASDLRAATAQSKSVIVVVAAHCGAGQFDVMSEGRTGPRVVAVAGCARDQLAPIRAGYLEFLLWVGVPLFGDPVNELDRVSPRLAERLPAPRRGNQTLLEAFTFADRNMPAREVTGECFAPPNEHQLIQCTPSLTDPYDLARTIRL